MVTINDIARRAKVSHAAVSDILNRGRAGLFLPATVARVQGAAAALGYQANHFAQSLKRGTTNIIGIASPDGMLFAARDPYLSDVVMGIAGYLSQHDFKLIFYPFHEKKHTRERSLSLAQGRMVDGLIYVLLSRDLARFKQEYAPILQKMGVPFVVVHSFNNGLPCHSVGLDCVAGGLTATEHLLKQHHYKEIGFVTSRPDRQHHADLLQGYRQALARHAVPVQPKNIFRCQGHTGRDGYRLADSLLRNKSALPRAFFTVSDSLALGMMKRFGEDGLKTPADVAFIGFSDAVNMEFNYYDMTVLEQPGRLKGEKAGEMLLTLIQAPKADHKKQSYIFEPKLIISKSCGCE